ncbi:phage tail protein, P2 protein I family [Fulvimarina manganoxydans]|uniref:Phage tail protein, P2 protein I family n=1 Tax=Fulvimarina manganoxydans TaxID=937218 RepID=A0A1W2EJV7_9HYPH|nr:phage tail protein I [Fulvimarina manganoxydans]SMD10000.1 phage tail protein, P2 protein I family [Fulvimarina manganoxydans]
MTTVDQILAQNAAPFERAMARAMSDDLPIPMEEVMDPYRTPERFLPFLAGHYSVDLWFDDWTVEKKREMVAQAKGSSTVYPGTRLADFKGTREGARRYLEFVDAEVLDVVAHPTRFVAGLSAAGITPVGHPPFRARYLVKVTLVKPFNAFVAGRSAAGMAAGRNVDLTPINRAKTALKVSKAPETEYLVSFAWRRPATFGDGLTFGDERPFGAYVDRTHL